MREKWSKKFKKMQEYAPLDPQPEPKIITRFVPLSPPGPGNRTAAPSTLPIVIMRLISKINCKGHAKARARTPRGCSLFIAESAWRTVAVAPPIDLSLRDLAPR